MATKPCGRLAGCYGPLGEPAATKGSPASLPTVALMTERLDGAERSSVPWCEARGLAAFFVDYTHDVVVDMGLRVMGFRGFGTVKGVRF
jgi:hypothetical protein